MATPRRRWARSWRWLRAPHVSAPRNVHRINAPAFTGAAVVAGHAPAQCDCGTPLFEVTHSGGGPSVFVASHPVGNAGGVTLSKFSSVCWDE